LTVGFDRGESALRYHDATKHSELSLRASAHYLDWDNKPSPFKVYRNLPSTALPHDFPHPHQESLRAIKGEDSPKTGEEVNLQNLTEILYFSGGLTRKMRIGDETFYMRAASATGALYPIELYVVSNGVQGLQSGVYHFDPLRFTLGRIRDRDFGPELAAATSEAMASSPATIVFTSLAWRNSWKYEARSYRHWFWDAGVMAANVLATCSAEGLKSRLLMGFVDSEVDQILGLEKEKEATVALAAIGQVAKKHEDYPSARSQTDLATEAVSSSQEDYQIIWETNKASELHNRAEIDSWRHIAASNRRSAGNGPKFALPPPIQKTLSLGDVILRRGSTRRFAQKPISFEALSTIIDASTTPIPIDFLSDDDSLIELYFIANDVQGLPPGTYYFDRRTRSLEQLKEGKLRDVSGYLCLEQLLFSDASVVFFLMTDLHNVLSKLGDRGYRAAQFEAGIRAGKIYLAAYAQGIGASGSTFYDDAVTEFFSPHAKDKSTMIAVGVGVPAYRAKPGRILPQFASS
jgi:SagB-type dehydrogenase family enzyme